MAPPFHLLNDDELLLVLQHLDLDSLCAARRATKALGSRISSEVFRKAWVACQKTLVRRCGSDVLDGGGVHEHTVEVTVETFPLRAHRECRK